MGYKPNQRVMLTKQLICTAFLALLGRKSIHQISIRELCAEAGINRTTFYNHYGSQYDVLAEIETYTLRQIAQTIENADIRDQESVHSRIALVLQYIENNLELFGMLVNNNIDERFADRLFSLPKIGDLLDAALSDVSDGREREATVAFAIHGSYKVLQDWINDPQRIDAEQEAELILGLAARVCRQRGTRAT